MEAGEPVRLWLCEGVRRIQRWHHSPADPHQQRWVTVGVLADGRWFVDLVAGLDSQSRVYPTEAQARAAAERLMSGAGPWHEIPASYDARARPATPGPWVKVGTMWRRP